ncbi:MAG TPA: Hint domain-containing protein [Ferrovibrio sp.]|uniref:Hint domain-containing protein n=1 Tax=Ferrovibrio sp. TaxID=1917215 RepID=UPI002B4B808C|nr:Hint domain-containing protein [Ferrovibrio sp.]HLT78805.1 Hint domain-containing protein [Ferrovibrio sp.]
MPGAEEDTIQGDGTLANSSVTVSLTGGSQTLYVHDAHVILNQTGGNDTLELNNSALTVSGNAAPQTVVFGEGANSLRLSEANYTNYGVNGMQITGMEQGDGIIAPDGYFISDFAYSGTTLTVSLTPIGDPPGGSTTHSIPISPVAGADGAALPAGSLQLNEDGTILSDGVYAGPAVCFLRGTLISTDRGEVAVQSLKIGDKVLCLSGVREVRWIGYRHDLVRSIPKDRRDESFPIVIRRNAIDDNVPYRDLRVSPWHHLYIGGVLIRAKDLVNGISIAVDRSMTTLSYYHVELDQFDMILAHGMHSESWADGGNRDFFHNVDVTSLMPADRKRRLAPRPGFERAAPEVVEQVRARLAERAAAIGGEAENSAAA